MEPAQKRFVDSLISWDLVRRRLDRYPAIRSAFPLDLLAQRRESEPYFCHYMAWRLGTWTNESVMSRLDDLLEGASRLPNWSSERGLLESAEFGDFWSLLWQLQVAEYLAGVGEDVQWNMSGPDLSVRLDGCPLFVECYSYHKSFGLELFIEEVLTHIGTDIHVEHDFFMPFSLPANNQRSEFLNRTLSPFLDLASIQEFRAMARTRYPVAVSTSASTLVIYVDGPDPDRYDPTVLPQKTGRPEEYLGVILREAVRAKSGSNRMADHRPNLLAVNYALSAEAQVAIDRQGTLKQPLPLVELGSSIDAFALSTIGINEALTRTQLLLVASRSDQHLAREITSHAW